MSISVSVGDMTYNAQILGSVQHGTRVGRGRGRGISGGGGWCCLAGRGGGRDAVGGREGNRSHCVGVAWVGGVCHGASCVRYIYTKSGQVATCRLQDAGYSMVWGEGRGGGGGKGKGEPGHHPTRTRQRPTEAVRGSTLVQTTGCRCHSGARARTWGPPDARPDRLPEPRRIAAHLVSGEKSRSPDVSVQCPHLAKLRLDMSRRLHCTALHCTMDALAQLDMSSATATACSHSRQHPTRTLILMLMLMLMLPPPPCA